MPSLVCTAVGSHEGFRQVQRDDQENEAQGLYGRRLP
jgi:hypothetical protein